jgi:hypothetical protein
MKSLVILCAFLLFFFGVASARTGWDSSPYNWKNSPHHWDNSPHKYNNDRIIRDNQGNATGYAVPKDDGGVNYYDLEGNRTGYKPGESRE